MPWDGRARNGERRVPLTSTADRFLDLEALRLAPLRREPFDFVIVPRFIRPPAFAAIEADFPEILHSGSYPPTVLTSGPAFRKFLRALEGPEFCKAAQEKLGIDLAGRPTMVTVRGRSKASDGGIHTDSKSKLVTALVYMNGNWEAPGGRLRLLRSPDNLDDVIAEVPPEEGTLVLFRNAPNAWHGFEGFEGSRRVVQLNWVTNARVVWWEQNRHRLSAFMKRLRR